MSYALLLAGWYPCRIDTHNGDFVQRHAYAISMYQKVVLLYLVKDEGMTGKIVETDVRVSGQLTEYIVYYRSARLLEKGASLVRYLSLGASMVRRIRKEHGDPSVVHVNVVWKAGLLALLLKRIYKWPYLLTEHWAGYTRENPFGLHAQSRLTQKLYGRVFKAAKLFLPVDRRLAAEVDAWFPGIPFQVVYNVVDTSLFRLPAERREGKSSSIGDDKKRFVHVSSMGFQKNIDGIIRVFDRVCARREDVELTMVGPYTEDQRRLLAERGLLDRRVFLTGALSYAGVAEQMRRADYFLLFSRYENLPCVIAEAHCCGLPVIATNVGGIPEIVDESNGLLVASGDELQLEAAVLAMVDGKRMSGRAEIAARAAERFSYEVVGQQLTNIYRGQNGKVAG